MSLITRVPGNMWARMMGKSVSLSLFPTGTRKQALVSRQSLKKFIEDIDITRLLTVLLK